MNNNFVSDMRRFFNCDFVRLWKDLFCLYRGSPLSSVRCHVLHLDRRRHRRCWVDVSNGAATDVAFYFDSYNFRYKIVAVQGIKALINYTITGNSRILRTSSRFVQWTDLRANIVYGLGFDDEDELCQFMETFFEIRESIRAGKKYRPKFRSRPMPKSDRRFKIHEFKSKTGISTKGVDEFSDEWRQNLTSTESIKNFLDKDSNRGHLLASDTDAESDDGQSQSSEIVDGNGRCCIEAKPVFTDAEGRPQVIETGNGTDRDFPGNCTAVESIYPRIDSDSEADAIHRNSFRRPTESPSVGVDVQVVEIDQHQGSENGDLSCNQDKIKHLSEDDSTVEGAHNLTEKTAVCCGVFEDVYGLSMSVVGQLKHRVQGHEADDRNGGNLAQVVDPELLANERLVTSAPDFESYPADEIVLIDFDEIDCNDEAQSSFRHDEKPVKKSAEPAIGNGRITFIEAVEKENCFTPPIEMVASRVADNLMESENSEIGLQNDLEAQNEASGVDTVVKDTDLSKDKKLFPAGEVDTSILNMRFCQNIEASISGVPVDEHLTSGYSFGILSDDPGPIDQSVSEPYHLRHTCHLSIESSHLGRSAESSPEGLCGELKKLAIYEDNKTVQELFSEIAILRDSLNRIEGDLAASQQIQADQFIVLENLASGLEENLSSLSNLHGQLSAVLSKYKRNI